MYKKLALISTVVSLSLSSFAFAEPHSSGLYIEGNLGASYASLDFLGVEINKFSSLGINTNIGYQFNNYVGLEAGATRYAFDGNGLYGVDVAAKFILPFDMKNNDFNIFAKVGATTMGGGNDRLTTPLLGLGAAYGITQNLDVNVQATAASNGWFSFGLLTGGLTYHF